MMGWTAPKVAATPPGSRCAATNSSGKNAAMFSPPSTKLFHHHEPRGSCCDTSMAIRPGGRVLMKAANRGWPSGSMWVVTMYVVPHVAGAKAVSAVHWSEPPDDGAVVVTRPACACPGNEANTLLSSHA